MTAAVGLTVSEIGRGQRSEGWLGFNGTFSRGARTQRNRL